MCTPEMFQTSLHTDPACLYSSVLSCSLLFSDVPLLLGVVVGLLLVPVPLSPVCGRPCCRGCPCCCTCRCRRSLLINTLCSALYVLRTCCVLLYWFSHVPVAVLFVVVDGVILVVCAVVFVLSVVHVLFVFVVLVVCVISLYLL